MTLDGKMKTFSSIIAQFGRRHDSEHEQIERQKIREELMVKYHKDLDCASWWKNFWIMIKIEKEITRQLMNRLYGKNI